MMHRIKAHAAPASNKSADAIAPGRETARLSRSSPAKHILFKAIIAIFASAAVLFSPYSIETARDMCPKGATNYFCRLDLAARVRVSTFVAVAFFFLPEMLVLVVWRRFFVPEMFLVVAWAARRAGRILVVARDAAVEILRAAVRGSQLAPSLYAAVHLLAYKESCAVERGLVARALAANANADEVPVATLLRLRDASVRQEAALKNFLGFAPAPVRAAFAAHAALGCVQDAARVRDELLAPLAQRIDARGGLQFPWPSKPKDSLGRRWFESQSCRVDSLQTLLDDLVRADAARARRATRGRAGVVAAAALGGLAAYVVVPLAL